MILPPHIFHRPNAYTIFNTNSAPVHINQLGLFRFLKKLEMLEGLWFWK